MVRRRVRLAQRIAKIVDANTHRNRKNLKWQKLAEEAGIELDEINCKALNIMKSDINDRNNRSNAQRKSAKTNRHKKMEYFIPDTVEGTASKKQLHRLRSQLQAMMEGNNVEYKRSAYLTKDRFDWERYKDDE